MPNTRVVSFSLCINLDCSFDKNDDHHLVVHYRLVELQRSNATAISYAWGEFERRQTVLGHFEDLKTPAIMELGDEWDLHDLRSTLHRISYQNEAGGVLDQKYFWIDQFSIAQNDPEEVKVTLARIPDIYRTFNVIALLAGAPCECWSKRAELSKTAATTKISEDVRGSLVEKLNSSHCISDLNLYPWVYRLWPRQETLYAENIRIVWTSPEIVQCPIDIQKTPEHDRQQLEPLTESKINRTTKLWLDRFLRSEQSIDDLRAECARVQTGLEHTLTDWIVLKTYVVSTSSAEAISRVFDFMRGEILDVHDWPDSRSEARSVDAELRNTWELSRFLFQLSRVKRTPRRATKPQDYVLSIWVDCPSYKIPEKYSQMTVQELLQDALQQFSDNHHTLIGTHAPLGLFGFEGPHSHFWAPNFHHEERGIDSVVDFYASMPLMPADFKMHNYLTADADENDFYNADKLALTLGDVHSSVYERFEWLVEAVNLWAIPNNVGDIRKDLEASSHRLSLYSSTSILIDLVVLAAETKRLYRQFGTKRAAEPGLRRLIGNVEPDDPVEPYRAGFFYIVENEEFNLDEVAYLLVANALGINYIFAHREGLQLVVQKSPSMLGFFRKAFKVDKDETFMRAFMTMSTWGDNPALVHQMMVTDYDESRRCSQVVGVWVPIEWQDDQVKNQLRLRKSSFT